MGYSPSDRRTVASSMTTCDVMKRIFPQVHAAFEELQLVHFYPVRIVVAVTAMNVYAEFNLVKIHFNAVVNNRVQYTPLCSQEFDSSLVPDAGVPSCSSGFKDIDVLPHISGGRGNKARVKGTNLSTHMPHANLDLCNQNSLISAG